MVVCDQVRRVQSGGRWMSVASEASDGMAMVIVAVCSAADDLELCRRWVKVPAEWSFYVFQMGFDQQGGVVGYHMG